MTTKTYTPALGVPALTPFYDLAIGLLTREKTWRKAVIGHITPVAGDRILDVGCGTGSLLLKLSKGFPEVELNGLDPDEEVLNIAHDKFARHDLPVELHQGFFSASKAAELGIFSKIVSSLVLHQTAYKEKKEILKQMHQSLAPGGKVCIADYGLQRSALMKGAFRVTVQALDGVQDTQPNADGCLVSMMEEAGFTDVHEEEHFVTPTGSISIYTARK